MWPEVERPFIGKLESGITTYVLDILTSVASRHEGFRFLGSSFLLYSAMTLGGACFRFPYWTQVYVFFNCAYGTQSAPAVHFWVSGSLGSMIWISVFRFSSCWLTYDFSGNYIHRCDDFALSNANKCWSEFVLSIIQSTWNKRSIAPLIYSANGNLLEVARILYDVIFNSA